MYMLASLLTGTKLIENCFVWDFVVPGHASKTLTSPEQLFSAVTGMDPGQGQRVGHKIQDLDSFFAQVRVAGG